VRGSWLLALALAACHGGVHRRGEWQVIGDVSTGTPADDFILSSTGADSPEIGARLTLANFVRDRLALLAAGTYRYYNPESGSLSSGELQLGGRYYPPIDFHAWTVPVAPFLDATGGVMHATADFPVEGTATNVTGEFGGGLEMAVGKHMSVLVGYHFRHLSNGGGNEPDNPGYNENQFFLGFGWRW
jgi:hypothetical protein